MEEWRPTFGGVYEASNLGRIRRAQNAQGTQAGKILSPSLDGKGRLTVSLSVGGQAIKRRVHQVIADAFLGSRPLNYEVNHINGDRLDNRPENLEYVPPEDNKRHAIVNRLVPHGEAHTSTKLTAMQVLEIRQMYATGAWTQKDLSAKFNITLGTINPIIKGKTWKHLIKEGDQFPESYARHRGEL